MSAIPIIGVVKRIFEVLLSDWYRHKKKKNIVEIKLYSTCFVSYFWLNFAKKKKNKEGKKKRKENWNFCKHLISRWFIRFKKKLFEVLIWSIFMNYFNNFLFLILFFSRLILQPLNVYSVQRNYFKVNANSQLVPHELVKASSNVYTLLAIKVFDNLIRVFIPNPLYILFFLLHTSCWLQLQSMFKVFRSNLILISLNFWQVFLFDFYHVIWLMFIDLDIVGNWNKKTWIKKERIHSKDLFVLFNLLLFNLFVTLDIVPMAGVLQV